MKARQLKFERCPVERRRTAVERLADASLGRYPLWLQCNSIPHLRYRTRRPPMIRSFVMLGVLALAATSNAVLAQQGGQPPAKGPAMALALEAAQAAVAACATDGVKVATSVVDSAGVLRLLLTADGASNDQIEISRKKAVTAVALKEVTSEVADKMEKDQAFKAKIEGDKTSVSETRRRAAHGRQRCGRRDRRLRSLPPQSRSRWRARRSLR